MQHAGTIQHNVVQQSEGDTAAAEITLVHTQQNGFQVKMLTQFERQVYALTR